MKISYKWLCDLLPGLDKIAPADLAQKLTFSGLEVEGIEDPKQKFKGIVVGEVRKKDKHPNADKLSVCEVFDGKTAYQVVCGAPNVQAGQKYPFATLGTTMPDGLEIKPVKLRQVDSQGMLCSAKELQISAESDGLLTLATDSVVGQDIAQALQLDDVIFELNVTPNRGDALSHWGVAYDVAALTGLKLAFGQTGSAHQNLAKPETKITQDAGELCRRFSISEVRGLRVGASPAWLARRLESLGIRSINNIVDATNYVMLLTGHPVHAYDLRNIAGGQIAVRTVVEIQKFKTLDGIERDLLVGDLIICDHQKTIGLAGVMGGENSEIKSDTTDVLLEVAHFDPGVIRKTSRRLGLLSDSSYRFERFVNPATVVEAHVILRDLIVTLAAGLPTEIVDLYPMPFAKTEIKFPLSEVERILGIKVEAAEIKRILEALQCVVSASAETFLVTVPLNRSDLVRSIDLVEEVARVHGLDKIPAELPRMSLKSGLESRVSQLSTSIKSFWVQLGFHETVHYSFGEKNFFKQVLATDDTSDWVELKNPLSEELAVMRPSLLPSLLACYQHNKLRTEDGLRFFEQRHVYSSKNGEKTMLAGLYTGRDLGRNRFGLAREADVYDAKGWILDLFAAGRIESESSGYSNWPFHPGQSLLFKTKEGVELARLGALHPSLLQELKIKESLFYFEIESEVLCDLYGKRAIQFVAPSQLPGVYRDLALLVPSEMDFDVIDQFLNKNKKSVLKSYRLFDVYQGEGLPAGKKSIALSMCYEDSAKSLTDEQVNEVHFALVDQMKQKLGVDLR